MYVMMQGPTFAQGNADERTLGGFRRLADRFRHFARLAVTKADAPLLVADHHKSGEAEATSTLHHFRDAVDVDQAVHKFAVTLFTIATATAFTFTSHYVLPSLAQ
jgi:hypothetical protein